MKPREADIVGAELDEDSAEPRFADRGIRAISDGATSASYVRDEGPDFGDESGGAIDGAADFDLGTHQYPAGADGPPTRPFENLPPLPPDLADAMEAFKLAILHHKLSGWEEVSRDAVLTNLDALRQLALAAS